jgi:hypothetical protein
MACACSILSQLLHVHMLCIESVADMQHSVVVRDVCVALWKVSGISTSQFGKC